MSRLGWSLALLVCLLAAGAWLTSSASSEPRFDQRRDHAPAVALPPVPAARAPEVEGLPAIASRAQMSADELARCGSWRGERCADPRPDDHDADGFRSGRDCDDADFTVFPGAAELDCDGRDQDCDGHDRCASDEDHDGFSEPADCDDDDEQRNPRAAEVPCNDLDEDCSGADLCDRDGDTVPSSADCDDADPARNYMAHEVVCDGIDQDCDGHDCCGGDGDGDGVSCASDCNDGDARIHPGAVVTQLERTGCTPVDLDCDGTIEGTNCL